VTSDEVSAATEHPTFLERERYNATQYAHGPKLVAHQPTGDRWVLHTGDAFYHHSQLDRRPNVPAALRIMERLVAFEWPRVKANHDRLAELHAQGDQDLLIVCAHDPTLFERVQDKG
jgi:hypothetical protein